MCVCVRMAKPNEGTTMSTGQLLHGYSAAMKVCLPRVPQRFPDEPLPGPFTSPQKPRNKKLNFRINYHASIELKKLKGWLLENQGHPKTA